MAVDVHSPLMFNNTLHAGTTLTNIEEMRHQLICLDLTLVFDDRSVLQGHKLVLAASSSFFRHFFSAPNSLMAPNPRIQIENTPMTVFRQLLDYAYTGRIDLKKEDLHPVAEAAKFFGFTQVERICSMAEEKFRCRALPNNGQAEPLLMDKNKSAADTKKEKKLKKTPLYRSMKSVGGVRRKTISKAEEAEEDVELVKALGIVLRRFEKKLAPRSLNTMKKWQEDPYNEKQVCCGLCNEFIAGSFEEYIQHIWENREEHEKFVKPKTEDEDADDQGKENVPEGQNSRIRLKKDFGLYKCKHCEKMFVSKVLRFRHCNRMHVDKAQSLASRSCGMCGKTFPNNYKKRQHIAHVHQGLKDPKKPCPDCGKMYSDAGLRVHRARDHQLVRKKCPDCPDSPNNVFKDAAALWNHRQRHHSNRRFRCTVCFKDFHLKSQWKAHYDVVHGGKRWKCHKCGKNFHSRHTLKRHLTDLHQGKQHICSQCGKKFSQQSKLNLHIREHNGDYPYVCFCGKGFMLRQTYKAHLEKKHQTTMNTDNSDQYFLLTNS